MSYDTTTEDRGLRRGTLGVWAIVMMIISAVAPMTTIAGVLPITILMANGPAYVPALILMMVLILIFSVGYVTMARHVPNASAFFVLIRRSLGRPAGGAAAMIGLLGYSAMVFAMLGMFGPVCSNLAKAFFGLEIPWWVFSLGGCLLAGALSYRRVDLSAKVLTALVLAEFGVIIALVVAIILRGLPGGFEMIPFSFEGVPPGALGIIFVFAFGGYSGFEATTLYSAEAKDPRRAIPISTYLSVIIIGVFFALSGTYVIEAVGLGSLVETVQKNADPIEFIFVITEQYAGNWLAIPMWVLFATSVFACILSFQNNVARYCYFLGKEGFLPAWFGQAHPVHQSPHRAAVMQMLVSVVVVATFTLSGLDPLLTLFAWLGNVWVLCLMVLMTVVSVGVLVFFLKNPTLEPGQPLKTLIMPAIAALGLAATVYQGFTGFPVLIGSEGVLSIILPALIPLVGVVGAVTTLVRPSALAEPSTA